MSWASSPGTATVRQQNKIRVLACQLGILPSLMKELATDGVTDLKQLSMETASKFIKRLQLTVDAMAPKPEEVFAPTDPLLLGWSNEGTYLRPGVSLTDAEDTLNRIYGDAC